MTHLIGRFSKILLYNFRKKKKKSKPDLCAISTKKKPLLLQYNDLYIMYIYIKNLTIRHFGRFLINCSNLYIDIYTLYHIFFSFV